MFNAAIGGLIWIKGSFMWKEECHSSLEAREIDRSKNGNSFPILLWTLF